MARTKRSYPDRLTFFCPGCGFPHVLQPVAGPQNEGVIGWNGDKSLPTFFTEVEIEGDGTKPTCHSTMTEGQIQFMPESTHELADQTVEVPDVSIEILETAVLEEANAS